jgi:ribokinase
VIGNQFKVKQSMDRTPSIAVIGSFVVGMSVRLPRMPYPGESLVSDIFDFGPGGKGNNAAIAAKRLGANVVLVERVGDDLFSDLAFTLYQKEEIDPSYVFQSPGQQTGVGLVYLQKDGENTIGLFKGANELLSPHDIQQARADILKSKVLLTQLEVPDAAILEGVKLAKENGLTVILNPAPARPVTQEILSNVEILTPNAGEAFLLLDKEIPADVNNIEDLKNIAEELIQKGPKVVIITMGSKGALLVEKGKEPFFQPSVNVDAVDTVGAGDSFNGALAVALAEGKDIKKALYRAAINGALTTTKIGVIDALPTKLEVQSFLEREKV